MAAEYQIVQCAANPTYDDSGNKTGENCSVVYVWRDPAVPLIAKWQPQKSAVYARDATDTITEEQKKAENAVRAALGLPPLP